LVSLAEAFFFVGLLSAAGTHGSIACSLRKTEAAMRKAFSGMGDGQRDVALYLAFLGSALGLSVIVMVALQVVGRLPSIA
jgi:hypothetical protein